METKNYDIIVIGAGSAGLSVGLFMNQAGFKVLMIAKSDSDVGGECLNDGCIPSKALIHASKIVHQARLAAKVGLDVSGKVDIQKVIAYVHSRQEFIRKHENAAWLEEQGIDVALGIAHFTGRNEVVVKCEKFTASKIVIATGSQPKKLNIPDVDKVKYYDNENIFHIQEIPERLLIIGGGPIGVEIAQAFSRLGSKVTIVQQEDMILPHDEKSLAEILVKQLEKEGIEFLFNAKTEQFNSPNNAIVKTKKGEEINVNFDVVFVAIGRELILDPLRLQAAGIEVKDKKINVDKYLRTSNKDVFVCGDIAGGLMFSHAAEYHARILLKNFFSPFKKKVDNSKMTWVTFTDPELATFGYNEKELKEKNIKYRKLEQDFSADDRAVTDNYQYGKLILYISPGSWFRKQTILGGTMLAPNAGELIQELILSSGSKISINAIFNKIYPYPTASRINQHAIVKLKEEVLTGTVKKLLKAAYKVFS